MSDEQLASLLQNGIAERPATPPELIYWRAELQARRQHEETAARPIAVAQWVGLGVLCASALAVSSVWWMTALTVTAVAGVAIALRIAYHSE